MTNPLIAKWEELHNPKKEEPNPQKTHAEKLKELRDISTVPVNTPNIITANHIPSLTTYDYDSGKDSFLQTAEKVEKGQAKVSSVSVERDIYTGTKITFEVWTT